MITIALLAAFSVSAAAQDAPSAAPASATATESSATAERPSNLPTHPSVSAAAEDHIAAGLVAFKKRQFSRAEIEFRKATEADPSSAAATFYLGYAVYKIAEPKRPFHPDKQKAAALFARAYELDPAFKPTW